MTFSNSDFREPALDMISTCGIWGPLVNVSAPASFTWESANRTVYIPMFVPTRCTIKRVWWANGATVTGGATITVAIYSNKDFKPYKQLVTGGAAQGTLNTVQFVTVTDKVLTPAIYWFALASTAAINTQLMGFNLNVGIDGSCRFQEATGTPPATATPVASNSIPFYVFGASTVASP